MKRKRWLLVSLLAAGIIGCSGSQPKEKKELPMEPNPQDALVPLMNKTQANFDYLVYGIMNFDQVKVERSVDNLVAITQYTAQNTQYKHLGSQEEWQAFCQEQSNALEDIKQDFLNQNYENTASSFAKALAACVKCHKPYRVKR